MAEVSDAVGPGVTDYHHQKSRARWADLKAFATEVRWNPNWRSMLPEASAVPMLSLGTERTAVQAFVFAPGRGFAPHAHAHSEQVLYVVEGEAKVRLGDEERRIGPGAVVVVPKDVVHSIENSGDDQLVVMMVSAPPLHQGPYADAFHA